MIEPATHESAALASPTISFYEGTNLVGTGTLTGNGTYATLALSSTSGITAGTHTYTASYTDATYGTYPFGSVTMTVNSLPTTNTLSLPTNQIPIGTYITLKSVIAVAAGTAQTRRMRFRPAPLLSTTGRPRSEPRL